MQVIPGNMCAIRIGGYRGHGGDQLEANIFVYSDIGDGYLSGQAWNGDAKLYVDGDYYTGGFAHYDGVKVEKEAGLQQSDSRFTLAMTVVTYRDEARH